MILIINRLFHLLKWVKNPAPLHGAVVLTTLLLLLIGVNIRLLIYAFREDAMLDSKYFYLLIGLVFFLLLYKYAILRIDQVIDDNIRFAQRKSLVVFLVFFVAVSSFIYLANINREKIFSLKTDLIDIKYDFKK